MKIGDNVQTVGVGNTKVYASATATTEIGLQPLGAVGVIIGGKTNGRWKVDFDTGFDGWVWEQRLGPYVPALTPPVNVTRPVITPTTVVLGEPNTVTPGTWTGNPTPVLTEEWMVTAPSVGGLTFVPTMSVKVRETASNSEGSDFIDSDPVPPIEPPPPPPPPPNTIVRDLVADFGAVAGSTTAAITATTNALMAFHDWAQKQTRPPDQGYAGFPGYFADANKDIMIELHIPAGDWHHNFNGFGELIRNLRIIGGSSTQTHLTNHNGSSWMDAVAFSGASNYFNHSNSIYPGFQINTVAAGATSVTLKLPSAGKLALFVPGYWCLVMSYNQQMYGYPGNMRYYDWAKVVSTDVTAGTVTFDTPLSSGHRSDCPYSAAVLSDVSDTPEEQAGPARIVPIDHPVFPIGERHEYSHFHVRSNPNWDPGFGAQDISDGWTVRGVIDGFMLDVAMDRAVAHSMVRDWEMMNCTWKADESDKICRHITFRNCTIGETAHHAGQQLWEVIGGSIGQCSMSAINSVFTGVAFRNKINFNVPDMINSCIIDGCTFTGPLDWDHPHVYSYAVGSGDVTLVSPTRIKVRKNAAYGTPWSNIIDDWGPGGTVTRGGNVVAGALCSLVSADASFVYVDFTGIAVANGDVIGVKRGRSLTVKNCIASGTGRSWSTVHSELWPCFGDITWVNNTGN